MSRAWQASVDRAAFLFLSGVLPIQSSDTLDEEGRKMMVNLEPVFVQIVQRYSRRCKMWIGQSFYHKR